MIPIVHRSSWHIRAPLLLSAVAAGFIYHDVVAKLIVDWWEDPNYSHGFLVPFISAYMIWERRRGLRATPSTLSVLGPLLLMIGLALFLVGEIAGELFTLRTSLVVTLGGLVLTFQGRARARRVFWPIAYLLFMIPLPYIAYDAIAFPLKLLATDLATGILHGLQVPIHSEGNLLFLPESTLEVADACSGIRSLISILALAVILARYTQGDWGRRIILVALSVPVVLCTNSLRIVGTGVLALSDPGLASGFFHVFSGEVIFLVGVVIFLGLAWLLKWPGRKGRGGASAPRRPLCPSEAAGPSIVGPIWPGWASVVFLALGLWLASGVSEVRATPILRPLGEFPSRIGDFVLVGEEEMDPQVVSSLGVDDYLMRAYREPSAYQVWLYIGYFEDQREGALIHSPKHCYPGSGWSPLAGSVREIPLAGPRGDSMRVNEYLLAKGEARQLVHYWYQSRGRVVANEYWDRLYTVLDSLLRRRSDGALVRISGPAGDDGAARESQVRFIKALDPILTEFLPS